MSRKWIPKIAFLFGFLLLLYPLVSGYQTRQYYKRAISTYKSGVDDRSKEELEEILAEAKSYNSKLFQSNGGSVDNQYENLLSEEVYNNVLNVGNGVIGSIEIPKIDVDLPIYHDTTDEVLSSGVGHQPGTSLPVGGENTRSVLTGHRGLPGSKLFTRLDEIVEGDYFFIQVLNETLAYRVEKIEVVDPEDVDVMLPEKGKDLVTLVTCTPYGLNTQRLVITGIRVPFDEAKYRGISSKLPSFRELLFTLLPFVLLIVVIVFKIVDRRKGYADEKSSKNNGCFVIHDNTDRHVSGISCIFKKRE